MRLGERGLRTVSDILNRSNVGYAIKTVKPEAKPMTSFLGWYVCLVCKEKHPYITKEHARSHGFDNLKQMIAAGKAQRRR